MTDHVFVNGVFDILHIGHIRLLKQASAFGLLTVGINSDDSVKRLKGEDRPINDQEVRREMLMALWPVSEVYIFEENNPSALLVAMYAEGIGPSYVFKGEQYRDQPFAERKIVESNGGQFIYYDSGSTMSTTKILENKCVSGLNR